MSEEDIHIEGKRGLALDTEGKTAPEIGQILSVSTNTIAFHLKNIVAKLASSNKIQAAVKATALGILR
jgi:LuxR family quorum-sensing system transcriptional regulator SolR